MTDIYDDDDDEEEESLALRVVIKQNLDFFSHSTADRL